MKLICGDSAKELKKLKANSIDALVTDPPAGIGFMGKEWDDFRRARNKKDADRPDVFGRTSKSAPEFARRSREAFVGFLSGIISECRRAMKPGAHGLVWAIPRTSHWTAVALEDAGFEIRDVLTHLFGSGFPKSDNFRMETVKGNSENTQRVRKGYENGAWNGWGTALKPACEFWILIRKPCSEKTVAQNVLKWGTGGINIDGCRVEGEKGDGVWGTSNKTINTDRKFNASPTMTEYRSEQNQKGRFPSHLILDEEAGAMLDGQSGKLTSGKMKAGQKRIASKGRGGYHDKFPDTATTAGTLGDSGGASRFFYCPKPSRSERNDGTEGMEKREAPGSKRATPAEGRQNALGAPRANFHPTVKAVALMRYLCRLITPPKGVVLDPFTGSGSTGIAAHEERLDFIGIEKDAEYFKIAEARIAEATKQGRLF